MNLLVNSSGLASGCFVKMVDLSDDQRAQLMVLYGQLIAYELPMNSDWQNDAELKAISDKGGEVRPELMDQQLVDGVISFVDEVYLITLAETNQVIGFLALEDDNQGEISAMFVHHDHRGKGYGTVMLAALQARDLTIDLSVRCFDLNEKALRFYKSNGFDFDPAALCQLQNVPGVLTGVKKGTRSLSSKAT